MRVSAVVVAIAGVAPVAGADTLLVEPGASIQAAIDVAGDGDEILVAPGTYLEAIDLLGKAITVRGTGGAAVTTIDGGGAGQVVTCDDGERADTVLDGFTITGGGAGMYIGADCGPSVGNCIFTDNDQGGLLNENGGGVARRCLFAGNFNVGLELSGADMVVADCVIRNNFGHGFRDRGDGIAAGPTIINCEIFGNDAAGMLNTRSRAAVINTTISSSFGPGLGQNLDDRASDQVAQFRNCILWNNHGGSVQGDPIDARFCNVEGAVPPGPGNVSVDPLFVDQDGGDLRLQPESPCIDAGDNDAVPAQVDADLDGNPRFLDVPETPDTGNGSAPIVDMGPYESLGAGCFAILQQEIVCHGGGTAFTVNVEGLNACTGGTTQLSFAASGGAPGASLCFTALVNDGGFCCSTELCVTIPDCAPALVEFLVPLGLWW